jgi:hypothetical protein
MENPNPQKDRYPKHCFQYHCTCDAIVLSNTISSLNGKCDAKTRIATHELQLARPVMKFLSNWERGVYFPQHERTRSDQVLDALLMIQLGQKKWRKIVLIAQVTDCCPS